MSDPQTLLKELKPSKEYFIGIDSDGCVFDSMEIKHKECFCPAYIKHFGLQRVSKYAREVWEFVNLYSRDRGANRFIALAKCMDLMKERKEVLSRNAAVPALERMRAWIKEETKLGNPALKAIVEQTGDAALKALLAWSEEVNARVKDLVYGVPPFPFVQESLEKAMPAADMIVVSQTPCEALEREWKENKIDNFVQIIAGQEMGTKTEHLQLAAVGKYEADKILMIGDAYGDLKAAKNAGTLFYPILPGNEEASWERFVKEALDKFLNGEYAGDYEKGLMEELDKALPETPPWC